MPIENDETAKYFGTGYLQLSKELEVINFKEREKKIESASRKNTLIAGHLLKKKTKVKPFLPANEKKPQSQIDLFQRSMKLLLVCGQCIGLNPVIGITSKDVSKMRFTCCSIRFISSCIVCACQAAFTAFSVNRVRTSTSISVLSFVSFYAGTCMTTVLFIRIASKWPVLMKKIADSSLDKYIDVTVHTKCFNITVTLLTLAVLEHLLSQSPKILDSIHCATENISIYDKYLQLSFPWFKELEYPLHLPVGILLQFINVISTINWSYSDLFIVCMCLYLVSILKKINKTIYEVDKRYYHPVFWSSIREEYTKATRLVTTFDDVISGLMLVSFASNLFFICLQLFHILSHGLGQKVGSHQSNPCITHVSRNIYDNLIYFIFSFIFVLGRFLAVSLVAASVHTTTKETASALYMVPSTAYCTEVQRFIEQVHGDNVALSGLQFFYITKGLVLTVASTIVTYELVLLQFNGENG